MPRVAYPPQGRRGSEDYEADASGSESSRSARGQEGDMTPERRELLEQIEQELAGGPSLDDLVDQADRLATGLPGFRRIRAVQLTRSQPVFARESALAVPGSIPRMRTGNDYD